MPPASAASNHTHVAYGGDVPHRRVRLVADGAQLREGFADIRAELGVPGPFPDAVIAAAEAAARRPRLPDRDLTDIGFVTIDPPGSMDLDQAMHIERRHVDGRRGGYRVRYAIADVAAFVSPGDPVDIEAQLRGETVYSPDTRTPLHPPALGEAAASLLPGQSRPALVWVIDLDGDGRQVEVDVVRAMVRSRARLDYEGAQARIEANGIPDDDVLALLAEVGRLRQQLEVDRGAVSLRLPEQEVDVAGDGFRLSYRAPLPVEDWNAQISLLTGMAAAGIMIDAGVGILRTLPAPDQGAIDMLRRSARALDVEWPEGLSYQAFVRQLDPATDAGAALLELSTRLLRGAGYTAFAGDAPDELRHAAVAAHYAHATAPLRRLVDRYVGELCAAACAGSPVPEWVSAALPKLPAVMAASDHRAHALERACVDLVETVLLAPHVGETFEAAVVERNHRGGTVQLRRPPGRARCDGAALPQGEPVEVRLQRADPATRTLLFAPVDGVTEA
jgi:exoribonuclease R